MLQRLGNQVEFRPDQTCRGQMLVNAGYQRQTLPLIRRNVETFAGHNAVVVPVGSVHWVGPASARDGRKAAFRSGIGC